MTELTFTIPGIDGEFTADLDELLSYKTNKQFAKSETEPAGMFEAFERVSRAATRSTWSASAAPSSPRACSCRPHSRRRRQKLPGFVLELEGTAQKS